MENDEFSEDLNFNTLRNKLIGKEVIHYSTKAENKVIDLEKIKDYSTGQDEFFITLSDNNQGHILENYCTFKSKYKLKKN
jgi:hypothetical protein